MAGNEASLVWAKSSKVSRPPFLNIWTEKLREPSLHPPHFWCSGTCELSCKYFEICRSTPRLWTKCPLQFLASDFKELNGPRTTPEPDHSLSYNVLFNTDWEIVFSLGEWAAIEAAWLGQPCVVCCLLIYPLNRVDWSYSAWRWELMSRRFSTTLHWNVSFSTCMFICLRRGENEIFSKYEHQKAVYTFGVQGKGHRSWLWNLNSSHTAGVPG